MNTCTPVYDIAGQHRASIDDWAEAAQTQEFAFHAGNQWRRSGQFAVDNAALWKHFGFHPGQFRGRTVIDVGAGSRLRTRHFEGARLIAIEPLAERFLALDFCDLAVADQCVAAPAEVFVDELAERADAVLSINALDHGYDFDRAIQNIAVYLRPHALAFLSFDLHEQADEMHPLLLTEPSCRRTFAACGLGVVHVVRGVGPFGDHYGHGEAISFWLIKGVGMGPAGPEMEAEA